MSNSFTKFTNFNLNIRDRLIARFAALTLLSVAAVDTTLWKVASVETEINRIVELRVPTAFASTATGEISNNSQQAAQGTQEVSSDVAGLNQAATEAGTAASRVLQATSDLATQADMLRKEVEEFLAEVRAA